MLTTDQEYVVGIISGNTRAIEADVAMVMGSGVDGGVTGVRVFRSLKLWADERNTQTLTPIERKSMVRL